MPTKTNTRAPRASAPAAPANPNAVALLAPKEAIDGVSRLFDAKREQILDLFAGDEAIVDRMRTLTLHALSEPKLLEKLRQADPLSVLDAIRQSAALGLMPIPALAEGYFVPYWNSDKRKFDLQFQPGYQGIAKLVLNSGRVLDVDAGVAYANDIFEYEEGSSPFVRHVRALKDRGERIATYAVARLPGGIAKVRVLDVATIEQHRKASKAAGSGPWVEWYDAMAMKTALRDLCKYLPKSATLEKALLFEAEAEERYATAPVVRGALGSGARDRVRARLGVEDAESASGDGDDGKAGDPASGASSASSDPESAVLVDPSGADTVEGEAKELPATPEGCSSLSDEQLGDVEKCRLAAGHPGPHVSEKETRWPNR